MNGTSSSSQANTPREGSVTGPHSCASCREQDAAAGTPRQEERAADTAQRDRAASIALLNASLRDQPYPENDDGTTAVAHIDVAKLMGDLVRPEAPDGNAVVDVLQQLRHFNRDARADALRTLFLGIDNVKSAHERIFATLGDIYSSLSGAEYEQVNNAALNELCKRGALPPSPGVARYIVARDHEAARAPMLVATFHATTDPVARAKAIIGLAERFATKQLEKVLDGEARLHPWERTALIIALLRVRHWGSGRLARQVTLFHKYVAKHVVETFPDLY